MANAYKCDICDNYYDSNETYPVECNNTKIREYAIHAKITISRDEFYKKAGGDLDICPDCYQKLVEFIRGLR